MRKRVYPPGRERMPIQTGTQMIQKGPPGRGLRNSCSSVKIAAAPHANDSGRGPARRCIDRQAAFFSACQITGCIGTAAAAAQIGRRRHDHRLREDRYCQGAFEEAKKLAVGAMPDEVVQPAVEECSVPVRSKRKICGNTLRGSDRLLLFLDSRGRPAAPAPGGYRRQR